MKKKKKKKGRKMKNRMFDQFLKNEIPPTQPLTSLHVIDFAH